jgi:hypothetical protein
MRPPKKFVSKSNRLQIHLNTHPLSRRKMEGKKRRKKEEEKETQFNNIHYNYLSFSALFLLTAWPW